MNHGSDILANQLPISDVDLSCAGDTLTFTLFNCQFLTWICPVQVSLKVLRATVLEAAINLLSVKDLSSRPYVLG